MTAPVTKVLQVASMPKKMMPAADHLNDQHADDSADDGSPPARQRGAADNHSGNDDEREIGPFLGIDRAAEADIQRSRKPADRSHEDQRLQADEGNGNAGEAGGFRVAADRLHPIAESRAVQHDMQDDRQRDEEDADDRDDSETSSSRRS